MNKCCCQVLEQRVELGAVAHDSSDLGTISENVLASEEGPAARGGELAAFERTVVLPAPLIPSRPKLRQSKALSGLV